MKLSKNKKIILLIIGLGILTTSIVTPIVVINNIDSNTKQNSKDLQKVNEIIAKIKKMNLLKNSNVDDGFGGTIFQDSFKNLWTMGRGTPLQVLKVNNSKDDYVNEGWAKNIAQGLLKSSNIDDGENGVIFQDSFKNLWVMGKGTQLQALNEIVVILFSLSNGKRNTTSSSYSKFR